MPMQVLCLGMPKTGTKALKQALDQLGIQCYHGNVQAHSLSDDAFWVSALKDKLRGRRRLVRRDFDQIFQGYGAAADMPPVAFTEELISAYPEAKIILVERNIDAWYESYAKTIIPNIWHPLRGLGTVEDLVGPWRVYLFGGTQYTTGKTLQLVGEAFFGASSKAQLRRVAKTRYREHYELVKRLVPPYRRLDYNPREGWAPLCAFLGREVPVGTPFPVANERQQFISEVRTAYFNVLLAVVLDLVLVIAVAAALTLVVRRVVLELL